MHAVGLGRLTLAASFKGPRVGHGWGWFSQTVELLAPYAVRHKNFKVRGKAGACIAAVVVEAAAIDDGCVAAAPPSYRSPMQRHAA